MATTDAAAGLRTATFASLAHRDFRYLLLGTTGSQLGMWTQMLAVNWLVTVLSDSGFQLALVTFIRGGASLASAPFAGALADSLDRRRLLLLSTSGSAAIAVVLAVLVQSEMISLWHLYVVAMLDGFLMAVSQPVRQAMIYDVVGPDDLTNAIGLNSVTMNLMRILGPAVGGLVIAGIGLGAAFQMQAACYAFTAATTLFLRPLPPALAQPEPFFTRVSAGFAYARRERVVLLLLIMAAVPPVLVYPYVSFLPLYVREVFNGTAFDYGVMITSIGVGSIPGSLAVARMSHSQRKGMIMLITTLLYLLLVAAFALADWYWLAFSLLVIAGVNNAVYMALNQTLLQLVTANEYRGRVLALHTMMFGLMPFGALPMGAAMGLIGVQEAVLLFSLAATAIVAAITIGSRRLREI